MKRLTYVNLILLLLMLMISESPAQVKIRGALFSSLYGWESSAENQQWDFYQGLHLRLSPENRQNLYLNTFLRGAYRDDPAEWQEKIYNLYGNWNISPDYKVRIGRQFLYQGVLNGTVDGALLNARPVKNLRIKLLAGTEAPYDRTLELRQWDEGNVLGGLLAVQFRGQTALELSYFQKNRAESDFWQQLGAVLHGTSRSGKLLYYLRLDYNFLSSDYQLLRTRIGYEEMKWSLAAEYSSQRPRIYEDSFFNRFEVRAHNQLRTAATYRLNHFDLGLQYIFTVFNTDKFYTINNPSNDSRVIATVANRLGTIGLIFQNGTGGKNIGYYGEVHYDILSNLTARLYNSFYNYERAFTNISEDALAFSGGLSYRLNNSLVILGEVQQSSNSFYKNDWRGLLRMNYFFNI